MDLTSVLGSVISGAMRSSSQAQQSTSNSGMDLGSIINAVANSNNSDILASVIKQATQATMGSQTQTSSSAGADILGSIIKQATQGSTRSSAQASSSGAGSDILGSVLKQVAAGSLNNMSTADIASIASNAAVVLKNIFGK